MWLLFSPPPSTHKMTDHDHPHHECNNAHNDHGQRQTMTAHGHKRPQPPQPPPLSKTTQHCHITTVASSCQRPPPSATSQPPPTTTTTCGKPPHQPSEHMPTTWHINGHAMLFDHDNANCPQNDRPQKRPSHPQMPLPTNDDHNQPQTTTSHSCPQRMPSTYGTTQATTMTTAHRS